MAEYRQDCPQGQYKAFTMADLFLKPLTGKYTKPNNGFCEDCTAK
jgi:hypothetical protein